MSASNDHIQVVHPPHFPSPKGYADGVVCTGRTLYVAGQIGWTSDLSFPHKNMAGQFGQALQNVIDVVREAGGSPEHIVKMTVYATDVDAYRQSLREIGAQWRTHMGTHFPAMALVGVTELVEREALVEIEAIASLPEEEGTP
jgi:enamine deaminase RidA (YjgF/YER057c/UK114 family)